MSLKALHLILISLSTILSFGFSYWALFIANESFFIFGLLGIIFSISLIIYGFWFLKKLKDVSYL
ncbi:MAG: hypothetical protein CMF98_00945 [Candidatus Marinimicrobia bacterium]|nr:hypothetical protein [Candidatus Neomarinimicrobiota bacterium]